MEKFFRLYPIGVVRKDGSSMFIEVFERYKEGLRALDQYSHVHLIAWFHENDTEKKRSSLLVHPKGEKRNPLTGVFATRSPVRPNLIALYVARLKAVEGTKIHIEPVEAFNGTPVIDIKPYLSRKDSIPDARGPDWSSRLYRLRS